jgi:hypothetical protein
VEWVLSLPHRLRYLLAWDHDLCRAFSGVAVRAMLGFLRRRAGRDGVADGRSGAVVVVQRFGGALNLNIDLHVLVLGGVFTNDGGAVRFHPVRRLTREDVAAVGGARRAAGHGSSSGAGPCSGGGRVRRRARGARATSRRARPAVRRSP